MEPNFDPLQEQQALNLKMLCFLVVVIVVFHFNNVAVLVTQKGIMSHGRFNPLHCVRYYIISKYLITLP